MRNTAVVLADALDIIDVCTGRTLLLHIQLTSLSDSKLFHLQRQQCMHTVLNKCLQRVKVGAIFRDHTNCEVWSLGNSSVFDHYKHSVICRISYKDLASFASSYIAQTNTHALCTEISINRGCRNHPFAAWVEIGRLIG